MFTNILYNLFGIQKVNNFTRCRFSKQAIRFIKTGSFSMGPEIDVFKEKKEADVFILSAPGYGEFGKINLKGLYSSIPGCNYQVVRYYNDESNFLIEGVHLTYAEAQMHLENFEKLWLKVGGIVLFSNNVKLETSEPGSSKIETLVVEEMPI